MKDLFHKVVVTVKLIGIGFGIIGLIALLYYLDRVRFIF